MKRILFIMHSLHYGGAERSLVNLLCELPMDRFAVDILLFRREGGFMEHLPEGVRVLNTPGRLAGLYSRPASSGRYLLPKAVGTLGARLLRKGRKAQAAWRWTHVYSRCAEELDAHYDAAVAFSGSEIMYYLADKVNADRKIVFIHNDYLTAGYSAADDAPYMKKMDVIASISAQCVETLKAVFPQEADKMVCVQNITSSAYVRRQADAYEPVEFARGGIRILSVGRLNPQKGFDLAIDAAAILRRKGIGFIWLVIGEGKLRRELQEQIDRHGLQDSFLLIGARDNPYPYIRACDILVQSSRFEGKSVVLDEAKILCKPIVATAYPTVSDQIAHEKEGIVTELDAEGIADGIMELIHSPRKREALMSYLTAREYGNQDEVEAYISLLDE